MIHRGCPSNSHIQALKVLHALRVNYTRSSKCRTISTTLFSIQKTIDSLKQIPEWMDIVKRAPIGTQLPNSPLSDSTSRTISSSLQRLDEIVSNFSNSGIDNVYSQSVLHLSLSSSESCRNITSTPAISNQLTKDILSLSDTNLINSLDCAYHNLIHARSILSCRNEQNEKSNSMKQAYSYLVTAIKYSESFAASTSASISPSTSSTSSDWSLPPESASIDAHVRYALAALVGMKAHALASVTSFLAFPNATMKPSTPDPSLSSSGSSVDASIPAEVRKHFESTDRPSSPNSIPETPSDLHFEAALELSKHITHCATCIVSKTSTIEPHIIRFTEFLSAHAAVAKAQTRANYATALLLRGVSTSSPSSSTSSSFLGSSYTQLKEGIEEVQNAFNRIQALKLDGLETDEKDAFVRLKNDLQNVRLFLQVSLAEVGLANGFASLWTSGSEGKTDNSKKDQDQVVFPLSSTDSDHILPVFTLTESQCERLLQELPRLDKPNAETSAATAEFGGDITGLTSRVLRTTSIVQLSLQRPVVAEGLLSSAIERYNAMRVRNVIKNPTQECLFVNLEKQNESSLKKKYYHLPLLTRMQVAWTFHVYGHILSVWEKREALGEKYLQESDEIIRDTMTKYEASFPPSTTSGNGDEKLVSKASFLQHNMASLALGLLHPGSFSCVLMHDVHTLARRIQLSK
jgi:hypothetical protein